MTVTSELVVEPMAPRHILAVEAIDTLVYSRPWSARTWRNELAEPSRCHLVARDGDTIVGHAGLLLVLDDAHVTTVAVHPDREGEGIATRLLLELFDEAMRHESTAATLEVRASQHRVQRLYARFGFVPAGIRRGYYTDPADDAVVMWLTDLDGTDAAARLADIRRSLHQSSDP